MKKEKHLLGLIVLTTLCLLILPYIFLGKSAYVLIDDNLDGEFVYFHVLKINKALFSLDPTQPIFNIMDGIPRGCLRSGTNIVGVLYYFLDSYYAYLLLNFLVRIIGFTGMFYLARDYFFQNNKYPIILACMFCAVPLYVLYGISVTGLPILVWSFLNLVRKKQRLISWIVILSFPFFSYFVMIGPFISVFIFLIGAYYSITRRQLHLKYWLALIILCLLFGVSELNLILSFFDRIYTSHRESYIPILPKTIWEPIKDSLTIFISGQYHSSSFLVIPIYILAIITFLKTNLLHIKKIIFVIIIALIFISFFQPFYIYLRYYFGKEFSILNSFTFYRFTFLIPLLWFILLCICLANSVIKQKFFYSLLIIQFIIIAFSNIELRQNVARIAGLNPKAPGFTNYFDPIIFNKVREFIDTDQSNYRIVCVGFSPSIAQYNGFYTLDSYQNNYPLNYKQKFTEIIKNEISKNNYLKQYFLGWGSRCYIFSDELEKSCDWGCYKFKHCEIKDLAINTKALKEMKGKYILSAVPILNANKINLKFLNSFSNNTSHWEIFLYKVQ